MKKIPLYPRIGLLLAILLIIAIPAGGWAGSARILVLPLVIHSEKDLSFLKNGIQDMLWSRLSGEGTEAVKSAEAAEASDTEKAVGLGAAQGADYVVFGSVTLFGDSVSTDVRFADVRTGKPVVLFNEFGKTSGDVIYHVNLFADRVNKEFFGRTRTVTVAPAAPARPAAPAPALRPGTPAPVVTTPVPWAPGARKPALPPTATAVAPARPAPSEKPQIWRSRGFKPVFKGMAMGDVDGDGTLDTVCIDDNNVYIKHYRERKFVDAGEFKGESYLLNLAVDVADVKGNGRAEIFVTTLDTAKNRLGSYVLEADGGQYRQVARALNWHFRVKTVPGRGPVLYGQKKDLRDPFRAGIYEMVWKNGAYEEKEKISLPTWINVYSFSMGDLLNNGESRFAAFTESDKLLVMGPGGRREWVSRENYGGSEIFLEYDAPPETGQQGGDKLHLYLSQRIHIVDIDSNGGNDMVVVRNHEKGGRLFEKFRAFGGGQVEWLSWNNVTFTPVAKTDEIPGYISDTAVGDLDGDGKPEVVFTLVAKTGAFIGKTSYIVVWDLL